MSNTRRSPKSDPQKRRGRPATTPEARENQLIGLAVDLAERQMKEGTASAQVVTHYLKLGSSRERLEQERLANENRLLDARVDQIASQQRMEDLYEKALNAMGVYSGKEVEVYEDGQD